MAFLLRPLALNAAHRVAGLSTASSTPISAAVLAITHKANSFPSLPTTLLQPLHLNANSEDALFDDLIETNPTLECMNRNARMPKKANHGKRPCSSFMRRRRRPRRA